MYCRRTAPPVAGSVKQTEDELVLKCKTSFSGEIMGHVVQTRRYVITFFCFNVCVIPPYSKSALTAGLALQHSMVKLYFGPARKGAGEVSGDG